MLLTRPSLTFTKRRPLIIFYARVFAPLLCRYLSRDPINHSRPVGMVSVATAKDYAANLREFFGWLYHFHGYRLPSMDLCADPELGEYE